MFRVSHSRKASHYLLLRALVSGSRRGVCVSSSPPARGTDPPRSISSNGCANDSEVRFDSPEAVTRGKSNWEVFRGWLVFKSFTFDALVDNSLKLYSLCKKLLGLKLTTQLLKATVFGQFAGGLDEATTQDVVEELTGRNISTIWFYSIERNLDEVSLPGSKTEFEEQERSFDEINHRYLKSIELSGSCNCDRAVRFAAVKLTAIVNPHLLNKLNRLLVASRDKFLSLASPGTFTVDRTIPADTLKQAIPELVLELNRALGFAEWTRHFSIVDNLHHFQQLAASDLISFNDLEKDQHQRFLQRLKSIGEVAESTGVCVLIDAEQSYFQSAIEHLTLHLLSVQHNAQRPLVYNTLQTYHQTSYDNLLTYLATATNYGIKSGIKVVRGCYMEHERARAKSLGETSPIHCNKQDTDNSYHRSLERLMEEVKKEAASIMVASHNKETVVKALGLMEKHRLSKDNGSIAFGQLLGMGDHLTYPLASTGHIACKVAPYGDIDDLMPFLSRRANENRGLIKNAQDERNLYYKELKRRASGIKLAK